MQPSRGFILLLGFLIGLTPLAIDMYLPSLPTIGRELHTSPELTQISVSIYLAFFAIPQLFFGPVSDAVGRRPTILSGLILFFLGSLLCAIAPTIAVLLIARALQGAGSAAISVCVPALVKDRFSGATYTSTMGFIMMVMALAPLAAPILGGLIFELSGWRTIFFLLMVVALICGTLFIRKIPETLIAEKRQTFLLPNIIRNYWLLSTDRLSICLSLCVGFMVGGLMVYITASPYVIIELYGIPEAYYGFFFGINVLAMMGVTYLSNKLVHHYSNGQLLSVLTLIVFTASLMLLFLSTIDHPSLWWLSVAFALFIANMGAATSNIQTLVFNQFPAMSGAASAFVGFFRFGVGAIAGAAVSAFYDGTATPLTAVMGICGIFFTVLFLLSGAGKKALAT